MREINQAVHVRNNAEACVTHVLRETWHVCLKVAPYCLTYLPCCRKIPNIHVVTFALSTSSKLFSIKYEQSL